MFFGLKVLHDLAFDKIVLISTKILVNGVVSNIYIHTFSKKYRIFWGGCNKGLVTFKYIVSIINVIKEKFFYCQSLLLSKNFNVVSEITLYSLEKFRLKVENEVGAVSTLSASVVGRNYNDLDMKQNLENRARSKLLYKLAVKIEGCSEDLLLIVVSLSS